MLVELPRKSDGVMSFSSDCVYPHGSANGSLTYVMVWLMVVALCTSMG